MKLDEEAWARIYPWLEKAQDVPIADLPEWLARISAEQPEVGIPLSEVLSHAAAIDDKEFLEGPATMVGGQPSRAGQIVGAYTIDSVLAAGGMGEVYLAHRSDGRFEGRYAVKLLHHGILSAKALDRFQHECRMLGRLAHPHIARLMDAGATADDHPFLVLEYIAGEHIDRYCETHSLSTQSRVRLFLDVLAAVAHAHTSLIIHRDIKPSNVLVTLDGVVKLLDFGIAKLVDPDSAPEDKGQLTRFEDVALTPSYAAPEQVLGEPLSTATDVYQLGVLLHVLLVGRLPPGRDDTTRSERVRAALEETPVRMSDAAGGGLRKDLRGDLDAIVEKSLRTRPNERYATAAALSADLKRYLDHEPVSAREGILAYRARKFIRRYRGAVLGVTGALVFLIVATAVSLSQTHKIRIERDRADQVTAFMTQIFKVSDPSEARGNTVTAREILDKSSNQINGDLGLDPDVQSDLLQVMADTYTNLGLYARAHSLAQAALDSRSRLREPDDPKTLQSQQQLGNILFLEGHVAEAEQSLRRTVALELQSLGPTNPITLQSQLVLDNILMAKGRYAEAETLARETLKLATETLGPENLLTLRTMTVLASSLGYQNRFADAESFYLRALAIQKRVQGTDHPDTLKTQRSLAQMFRNEGRYAEAEVIYRDVLAIRRRVLGDEHPETADTLTTLAILIVHDRSRTKEAEELYRAALAVQLRQAGPESRFTTRAEEGLANVLGDQARYAEAEPLFREVLRVRTKLLGPDNTDTLLTERNLGCLAFAEGHFEEAERIFRDTLAQDERVLAADDRDLLGVKYWLADTLLQEHRPREAETLARQAFEGQVRAFGPDHSETLNGLNRLGRSLAALGRYGEAQALYVSTIDKIAALPKADVSKAWYAFGVMAAQSGHADEAFDHLEHAASLGYNNFEAMRSDDDLKTLRTDPRFARLIERMQSAPTTG